VITADPDVKGIHIHSDYTGTISQNNGIPITIGADGYTQDGGTFTGAATGDIDLNGDFTLSGGTFTSTAGTMTLDYDFTVSGGIFAHNSGTVM